MADHDNDIDALLDLLAAQSRFGFHSALTALVAERDALKQRVDQLEMYQRVGRGSASDSDPDLRQRLVCAIWPQMLQSFDQPSVDGSRYEWQAIKAKARNEALAEANAMIAAMRKGEADGK